MNNKKSAKDIAFDRERAKYRHEINQLRSENAALQAILNEKNIAISALEDEKRSLENEKRLLQETISVPLEDLLALIEEAKHSAEIREKVNTLFSFPKIVTSGYGGSFASKVNTSFTENEAMLKELF